ncbi:hypothetical protein [Lacihabitans soyangensis]|uniref:hypothetical protein n=1 Tax=Lacihabitans soyangensis TaxID=869394 RepID=UPI0020CF1668|nr:hypothetical protein [Lacihabitans soyangensis]
MLSVLGGLVGVGILSYSFSERGNRIEKLEGDIVAWENEKKVWFREKLRLQDVQDSLAAGLRQAQADMAEDSVNYAEREAQMQLTIRDVLRQAQDDKRKYEGGLRKAQADKEKAQAALRQAQADTEYWKDYAEKLESGNYEVKMGVWPFRGKRLVPKSPTPSPPAGTPDRPKGGD